MSISDDGGSKASTTSTATVAFLDAALSATGVAVSSDIEGNSTGTVTVATFTDGNPSATTADFTATIISWGDGTTSTGTVSETGSTFSVSGSHTYSDEGTDTISVLDQRRRRQHGEHHLDRHGRRCGAQRHREERQRHRGHRPHRDGGHLHPDGNPSATTADFAATINRPGDQAHRRPAPPAERQQFLVSGSAALVDEAHRHDQRRPGDGGSRRARLDRHGRRCALSATGVERSATSRAIRPAP